MFHKLLVLEDQVFVVTLHRVCVGSVMGHGIHAYMYIYIERERGRDLDILLKFEKLLVAISTCLNALAQ
jgi:hypothetical protein